jgi:alkylhydroperoxidase/carboxymuconolactone decarboxylase family protein YurZ
MIASAEETFRRLTIGDPRMLSSMVDPSRSAAAPRLDARTGALLVIAALIALDAPASSYREPLDTAQRVGATMEDLIGVIAAVAPAVGSARIVSAAPRIALAAGYDVEAALE